MYKQVLNSIVNIDLFPLISMIIFFSFFLLMLYKVIYSSKEWENTLAALPLDNDLDLSVQDSSKKLNV